ncbi:MAG: hypothetical protein B6D42_13740, partial [Anaerolineae bacterium UTCFX5]
RVGEEHGLTSSFVCDPTGQVLVQAGRDTREVIVADIDMAVLRRMRALFPLLHQRKPKLYGRIVEPTATEIPERWRSSERLDP